MQEKCRLKGMMLCPTFDEEMMESEGDRAKVELLAQLSSGLRPSDE